jgi:hypothetical protein
MIGAGEKIVARGSELGLHSIDISRVGEAASRA